jgi:hypothetical protein
MGRRRKVRQKGVIPVRISGTDSNGDYFNTVAHTLDISSHGARLGSVHVEIPVGPEIIVQCQYRRARFRVVWVSPPGSDQHQVGLECLEPDKNVWGMKLPDASYPDNYDLPLPGSEPSRERRAPRFEVSGGAEVRHVNSQDGQWADLTNLSLIGCYCKTATPLPVLTRVRIILRVEGTEIDLLGVIRSCNPNTGMAIEFTHATSAADAEQLKALLQKLEHAKAAGK